MTSICPRCTYMGILCHGAYTINTSFMSYLAQLYMRTRNMDMHIDEIKTKQDEGEMNHVWDVTKYCLQNRCARSTSLLIIAIFVTITILTIHIRVFICRFGRHWFALFPRNVGYFKYSKRVPSSFLCLRNKKFEYSPSLSYG